jgi:hypothetical protein
MIRKLEITMDLLALPAYYRRSRQYLDRGPRHLLMYVFGRFGMVRSCMVWLYSQGAPKPPLMSGSSLIGTVDVDGQTTDYCPGGHHLAVDHLKQLHRVDAQFSAQPEDVGAPARAQIGDVLAELTNFRLWHFG